MWNGMLLENTGNATDVTVGLGKDLLAQLANIKFEGVLLCVIGMLVAGFICLEGYGIYKAALSVIGFCVGFTHSHNILAGLNLGDEGFLMVQTIAGLVCAVLAVFYVQVGVGLAVYHFVQDNLAAILAAALAEKLSIPQFLFPVFAAVVGVGAGIACGFLAMKATRPAIVIVTAVVGGFAAVNFFVQMVPQFPVDMHYIPGAESPLWAFAKILLAAAGVGIQGIKGPK